MILKIYVLGKLLSIVISKGATEVILIPVIVELKVISSITQPE
jgi:hypothetical protein